MPRDLETVNPTKFNVFDYDDIEEFYFKTKFGDKNIVIIRWEEVPPRDGVKNWVWHLFYDHVQESLQQLEDWKDAGGRGLIPFHTWFHPDMKQIIEFETEDEAVDVGNNFPETPDQDPNGAYGYAATWINGEVVTENT
jgi:hypothetical protein